MKRLRLADDEIAIPIKLTFPSTWGRVLTSETIEIAVPDFRPKITTGDDPADERRIEDVHLPDVPTPFDSSPVENT